MTFTIELDDDLARQLEERAAQTHMTPHQMAIEGLRDFLKNQPTLSTREATNGASTDVSFERAVEHVLEKNAELYRRLA